MGNLTKIAMGSIVVGIVVLAIKFFAYYMTGSIALLSDAMESIVNVATAIAAFVAIRLSAVPADANHPYGHHKAEYFSAVLEGVMIIVAAVFILNEAYHGFMAPRVLNAPLEGLLVNIVASVINGAWCWVLLREGKRRRSPALLADGKHLWTDVLSSVGVTIGVLAAIIFQQAWLDPALAALVALNIIWSGWQVVKESTGGLMDEAVPDDMLAQIKATIQTNADGAIEAHDVRTRMAGHMTFVDFHLVVAADMSVSNAHDICDNIEQALKKELGKCHIAIHVEPENKAKHAGIVVV